MPRYHVYITETVSSAISIDAENAEEAGRMVKSGDYNAEDQSDPQGEGNLEIVEIEECNE